LYSILDALALLLIHVQGQISCVFFTCCWAHWVFRSPLAHTWHMYQFTHNL
jgi:hypothetical protein